MGYISKKVAAYGQFVLVYKLERICKRKTDLKIFLCVYNFKCKILKISED